MITAVSPLSSVQSVKSDIQVCMRERDKYSKSNFNEVHLNVILSLPLPPPPPGAPGGWTTTAFALALTQRILNPSRGYGARPFSLGIPKVAVLLTDGRSNLYPIHEIAPLLRNSGVQVITIIIGIFLLASCIP